MSHSVQGALPKPEDRIPYAPPTEKEELDSPISDGAARFHIRVRFQCNTRGTDGWIDRSIVDAVTGEYQYSPRTVRKYVAELVDGGIWASVEGGWRDVRFLWHSKSAEQRGMESKERRDRRHKQRTSEPRFAQNVAQMSDIRATVLPGQRQVLPAAQVQNEPMSARTNPWMSAPEQEQEHIKKKKEGSTLEGRTLELLKQYPGRFIGAVQIKSYLREPFPETLAALRRLTKAGAIEGEGELFAFFPEAS